MLSQADAHLLTVRGQGAIFRALNVAPIDRTKKRVALVVILHKQFVYNCSMIESFSSAETERLFTTGKSRRLPPGILRRAVMRLTQLDAATMIDDLRLPPSNRLEALLGSREGQWSIRINEQWRVCFQFERGNAQDVEIVDYH